MRRIDATRIGRWALEGRRAEWIVAGLALAVRAIHFAGVSGDPLFEVLRMDPRYHDAWATRIAGGVLFADEPFFRAPLYPYFLALLYTFFDGSVAIAKGLQLALGTIVPLTIVALGRAVFSPRVALAAGVIVAVYPLNLRFDGDLLLEGPFVVLLTLALWLEHRALQRPGRGAWLWTGVAFGLAAITRPNVLAYVVLIPVVHWLARRGSAGENGRRVTPPQVEGGALAPFPRGDSRWWVEAGWIALGVCLPLAPVALHNAATGDFVPIATQAGVNFYIGNNPESDGFTAVVPGTRATWWGGHDDAVELASRAAGRPLRPSEVSDYWLGRGLAFIAQEPGRALQLTGRKLYLFWWGGEISNNEHIYFSRYYSLPMRLTLGRVLLFVPFGVLAPLGLLGMARAWRRPRARPMAIFVLAYMGSVVLFFVCARFRYPVIPALTLFAAFGVLELWRHRRQRVLWGALLVLVLVLNGDPYRVAPAAFGSQALSYIDLGIYHMDQGDDARAIEAFEEAARLDPGHPAPHAGLGKVYLRTRRFEAAEAALRYATRGDPVLFRDVITEAQKDLGRIYLQTGRPEPALAIFSAALTLRPDFAQAMLGVGYAERDLGRRAEARRAFERVLELDPSSRAARAELDRLEDGAQVDPAP